MSRYTSPGSTHSRSIQQTTVASSRQKSKQYATGIAAGAEDVKYQAKYKELRRKVKEIEADNDKLHFKVLQAKRSIQRMRLERAVLYERLTAVPPSPDLNDRNTLPASGHGPPPGQLHSYAGSNSRQAREQVVDVREFSPEYGRGYTNSRVTQSEDRPYIPDAPMGPGIAPSNYISRSNIHRASSGSGRDSSRQLPPLPQVLSGQHHDAPHHHHSHPSPHAPSHLYASSPLEHSRSSNRSRQYHEQSPLIPGLPHPQQHPQDYAPHNQHLHPSAALSDERERSSRRHHIHELTSSHSESPSHTRHPVAPPPRSRSSDAQGSNRVHSHQRNGPGTHISRNDDHHDREFEREREWEQTRELARERDGAVHSRVHSPPMAHSSVRHLERDRYGDYSEGHPSSRVREDAYYHDSRQQRSVTPASDSSAHGDSRPDSRSHFYDNRNRYSVRPVDHPNGELDVVHEGGRSESRDRGRGVFLPDQTRESRKRSRNDMEALEGGHDVIESRARGSGGAVLRAGSVEDAKFEDRGTKRFHQDSNSNSEGD